jgi:hypothetical protein
MACHGSGPRRRARKAHQPCGGKQHSRFEEGQDMPHATHPAHFIKPDITHCYTSGHIKIFGKSNVQIQRVILIGNGLLISFAAFREAGLLGACICFPGELLFAALRQTTPFQP